MMVTVCISTDLSVYSSVMIYLIPTASISAVGPSYLLQPVLTDCNSLFLTYTCIILLHQTDTALTTQTDSSEQSVGDNSLIQL